MTPIIEGASAWSLGVGGIGVLVGGIGVLVGGIGVSVGTKVEVGGIGVFVGGTDVLVGGIGVSVGTRVEVGGIGVFVGVSVGGTDVFVGAMLCTRSVVEVGITVAVTTRSTTAVSPRLINNPMTTNNKTTPAPIQTHGILRVGLETG